MTTERRLPSPPDPMYTPEFCCRLIEPGLKLEAVPSNAKRPYGHLLLIPDSSGVRGRCVALTADNTQEAWREAFEFLDRRKENTQDVR